MPHAPHPSTALRRFGLGLLALLGIATAPAAGAAVVISQVYGGGGNGGATLRHDFIELFNNGSTDVAVGGWSVQYASATGSTWQVTALPAGTVLPAGRYLLVRQAVGAGGSVDVVGDVTGTLAMGGNNGKVALSSASSPLSGTLPTATTLVDIVSYGSAGGTEGSPTPALGATTAAWRKRGGCTDTNDNAADFEVLAPAPRSLATPAVSCGTNGGGGGVTPPEALATTIPAIQGSGVLSPLAGRLVRASGIVTRITNNGFFLQDAAGDNDPATSDGLFVFANPASFSAAQPGNRVEVTGTVVEFNVGAAGNAQTAAAPLTELTGVTAVTLLGTGSSITPTPLVLPLAAGDSLERFEGMLVRIDGPLTVQQNFFQARYGQLTLGASGRHENPTNRHLPGSADAVALAALQARGRLLLDDGSSLQNPNPLPYAAAGGLPRAGDTVSGLTGVIDYGLATASNTGAALYRLQPVAAPVFVASHPRPAAPAAVGGNLRVASMNVLNYFTTFTDGGTATGGSGQGCLLDGASAPGNCRGANNLAEFNRQRAKIVLALAGLDADVVGLMEIQNNGGTAAQNLVDALNARVGAGTYAVVPDPAAGTGSDAIRVAMIYKPGRLSRVGDAQTDTDPLNNRPPLAQTFAAANGERFAVVVNHLKSKGSCPTDASADADQGDGQGCWNDTRRRQAQRLLGLVSLLRASTPDVLLIGDMNAYGQEDPIRALIGGGFVDQMARFSPLAYSYVFDGTAGRLDHGLASVSLSARVAGAAYWHINADENSAQDYNLEFKQPACATCAPDPYDGTGPWRSSDHDPALLGLHLYKTVAGTAGRDTLAGSPGDDILVGGPGADLLTGGAGINLFAYTSMRDAGDTVTDFVPGKDVIDLRTLLAAAGYAGSNAVAEGWVRFVAMAGGTSVQVDVNGPAGGTSFRPLLTLAGVAPASLLPTRDLAVR